MKTALITGGIESRTALVTGGTEKRTALITGGIEKRTALVTGGATGIGAATARALAADGYRVVLTYNTHRAEGEALAAELNGVALWCDVADADAVRELFSVAGGVDALVCCAGVALTGLFTDTAREWERVFAVNVGGVINCCNAAIPRMVRERSGCIVTVSSIWGLVGASCEAVYSASKAAVVGLTKSLAKELAPSGIRVNCVAPGVIDTAMNANLTPAELAALRDETPLGTLGTPDDAAQAVRYLASEAARFVTGQVLSPNGGVVI
ncbi:MAG: SDR family oxidoreductase [Oscillospiraceae bacterium]|jgi:3-oxoacyl-[acyl-carrier protein] reductase|nr:SDR family oxidoreductase [Oscillospiraceae bacterium]